MKVPEKAFRVQMHRMGITDSDVVAAGGRFEGGWYECADAGHKAMMRAARTRFGPPAELAHARQPEIAEPTLAELAGNFGTAMARWSAAGFATVTEQTYQDRARVCESCVHWNGTARLGLGICKAPGCGCTRFKRWLATERCPLGKWPAV